MHSTLIDEIELQKEVEHNVAQYHKVLEKWAEIIKSERQEILGVYMCRTANAPKFTS